MIRILVILLLIPYSASALTQEYLSNNRKRLEITISNSGINRIEVEKDRILKVVGSQEDYNIEGDSAKGFIFISTALDSGEEMPITIITENGLTQDLNLIVKNKIAPVTIILKSPAGVKEKAERTNSEVNIETQITNALQDVVTGNTRHFSFRTVDEDELKNLGFTVNKATAYSNKSLTIFRYEYFEKPNVALEFPGALAVAERGNAIYVVYRI